MELERELRSRDETVAELKVEVDRLVAERETLRRSAEANRTEHEQAISSLNAVIETHERRVRIHLFAPRMHISSAVGPRFGSRTPSRTNAEGPGTRKIEGTAAGL